MTTPIAYPLVNGNRHSFSSIELKLGIPIYQGIKAVNYTWALEPEMVYGFSPDPLGQTIGVASYSADLEMLLAEYNQLLAQLGPGFAQVYFNVQVSYIENGFDTIVDTLVGCRIKGGDASQSQGPGALTRKVPLSLTKILLNGVDCLTSPLKGVAT